MKRLAFLVMCAVPLAGQSIPPRAIAAHMRFLADDLLEGRETGTRGFDIAAQYVAAQFAAAGLRPVGASWFQPVSFRSARIVEESMSVNNTPLERRKDFVLSPSFEQQRVDVTAPVSLAGFGIVAPELKYDDYAGLDVRGKIVLMLSGAPARFPADQRAYYSATTLKLKRAAERGAVAVLFLNSKTDDLRMPFQRRVQQDALPAMRYLDPSGAPADATGIAIAGRVSNDVAARLLAGTRLNVDTLLRDAEENQTHSLSLLTSATLHAASEWSAATSANVVGVLRGTDAKLRSEYLVVSAHLDHLGNHTRQGTTDTIYNGAQDNASGIACVIEIARALARKPPRRSVVFVAFTGEEKGEQGSRYFARNPPLPKDAIVADINMDMPLFLAPLRDVIALGGEHSTLGGFARRAASEEEIELGPDPLPEEVRFIRSDQFSFVQEGVPAIHLKSGNKSGGVDVTRQWLRTIYHTPADDMSQHIDFDAGAKYANVNLRLIREVADAPQRPRWKAGDFFATAR